MTISNLSKLQAQMSSCRLCTQAGYEIVPRAIFSGRRSARVMIIGQAPGVTEAEAGRPFNAGSGSRLFEWLGRAGFVEDHFRAEQYMTSVTKCFPGKSKNGGGDRVPSRQEQMLCRAYLEGEIQLVDPQLILPVGRLAINLFFAPSRPLAEIVGSQVNVDGRVIIPLPHPSGASRWHQIEENRAKIDKAIALIKRKKTDIGI